MFPKVNGDFSPFSEHYRVGVPYASLRSANERSLSLREFSDLLIEKLRYTSNFNGRPGGGGGPNGGPGGEASVEAHRGPSPESIVAKLFDRLDDDGSESISIDEINPTMAKSAAAGGHTRFGLAAFIETILRVVFAYLHYHPNPVLRASMSMVKFGLFIGHMKMTLSAKTEKLLDDIRNIPEKALAAVSIECH